MVEKRSVTLRSPKLEAPLTGVHLARVVIFEDSTRARRLGVHHQWCSQHMDGPGTDLKSPAAGKPGAREVDEETAADGEGAKGKKKAVRFSE
jgi:hypothetical protein